MSKFVNKAREQVRAALAALARLAVSARSAATVRLAGSPLSARAVLLAGLARSAAARRLAPLAASHVLRSAILPGGLFLLFMSLAAFAAVDRPRDALAPLPDPALENPLAGPENVPAGFRAAIARNEYRAYVRPLDPARPRTAPAARASAEAVPASTSARPPAPLPGKALDKSPGKAQDQDPAASTPRQFEKLFAQAAEEYGLPADLLSAVAQEESSWNPYALNIEGKPYFPADKAGAARLLARNTGAVYDVGLMQINSHWIRKYGINPVKLLDPETNIRFGAWILRGCFEAHGLTWRAVGAYHTGHPERRPERTMNYASRVIQRYEELAAVQ
jgi:soluble lytic murein transglycosylase-like protein